MLRLVYLVTFIVSLSYLFSLTTKVKGNKKIALIFGIIIFYIICFNLGNFLGCFAGAIFDKKYNLFDAGLGHRISMILETITFIPAIVSIYIQLYRKKKIRKSFAIVFTLGTIIVSQGAYFLFLISL